MGSYPTFACSGRFSAEAFRLTAIAGSAEIMAHFDKEEVGDAGFVFQNGTLSGNPVAAVAGWKTLQILRPPDSYDRLKSSGNR